MTNGARVTTTLTVDIDRSSPVPLYFQVAQVFEKAIVDGKLKPGDRFENELALAKRLNLSRPTTRRAIQELVDKGMLVRKRGVGTQVVQTPVHRPVELTSLFDDLVRGGQEPATTVLDYHIGHAPEDIVAHLNLATDADVLTNYLPAALAPDRDELEQAGLYQALRSRGVHIRLARQQIGAKVADREEARLLDEKPKAPLLVMNRTAFDDSGRVVEYGSHVYRASRYYFETTLVDR
jgi:DNA-binding GntR family transcriptional regulator